MLEMSTYIDHLFPTNRLTNGVNQVILLIN